MEKTPCPENEDGERESPPADEILSLVDEIRAYTQAVDDKNRAYGIKNYSPKNRGQKEGYPETLAASMTKEE
jgi:hypothetical protein